MVIYFSATGNSEFVAQSLGKLLGEEVFSVPRIPENRRIPILRDGERLILVLPVHSWGPALPMVRFLRTWLPENKTGSSAWAVFTCGDDCAQAGELLGEELAIKGWRLSGCFSVQMPNNYILLPGFDVDPKSVERRKLDAAPERIASIARQIEAGDGNSDSLYVRGSWSGLKSRWIYPLFARWFVRRVKFYATDACVGCGLCERVCPTGTVRLDTDKIPRWQGDCVQCLACIHACPQRAIEYGKATQGKGRYRFKTLARR